MVGLYFQLCQGSWLSFKTLTAVAETPLSRQRRYMRHKEGGKKTLPPSSTVRPLCARLGWELALFIFFWFIFFCRDVRSGERWLSEGAPWKQADNEKWGREPLSPAAHVWVRAVDPAKPQWLRAQLAVQIISRVPPLCRSLSKSKALLQERRVQIRSKWETAQANSSV